MRYPRGRKERRWERSDTAEKKQLYAINVISREEVSQETDGRCWPSTGWGSSPTRAHTECMPGSACEQETQDALQRFSIASQLVAADATVMVSSGRYLSKMFHDRDGGDLAVASINCTSSSEMWNFCVCGCKHAGSIRGLATAGNLSQGRVNHKLSCLFFSFHVVHCISFQDQFCLILFLLTSILRG